MTEELIEKCLEAYLAHSSDNEPLGCSMRERHRCRVVAVLAAAQQHESAQLAAAEKVVEAHATMMQWLMNVHTECVCNTIANPCPRCRIRVHLAAYPPKPASGTEQGQRGT